MKQLFYILSIFLITCSVKAQTVSFSPTSIDVWGTVDKTMKVSVEYKNFEATIIRPYKDFDYISYEGEYMGSYKGWFIGLFYNPIDFDVKSLNIKSGVGLLHRPFPNEIGERLQFTMKLSYRLTDHIGISYSHYSNGFGLWNYFNPGLDNISIAYHF